MTAGMEVAAALTDKAHSVSVIGIESVPFKKALGEKVGKAIMKVNQAFQNMKHFHNSIISILPERKLLVKMQIMFRRSILRHKWECKSSH